MNPRLSPLVLVLVVGFPGGAALSQDPIEVEPKTLASRRDLIGREIVVDDRVKMYFPDSRRRSEVFEVVLWRTSVPVILPEKFHYESRPSAKAIRVFGVLRADGKDLALDVTRAPELFKTDVDRLQKAIKSLAPEDFVSRSAWGDWAAARAQAFDDPDLKQLADQLQAESIALELRKPGSRTPEAILTLAAKAKKKGVAEPEPSALCHLALRLKMLSAKTKEDYRKIADEALSLLPAAKSPAHGNSDALPEAYKNDPASTYRNADPEMRATLDRKLYTDALSENMRIRATDDPKNLDKLADEAKGVMPDRPEIAGEFRRHYFELVSENVAQLSEADMVKLARTYREDLKQPAVADSKIRTWLDYRRKNYLGASNAEQRDILAAQYWTYLKDKVVAAELLREALKIDPTDPGAPDLFLRMGYVKSGDGWRDPRDPSPGTDDVANSDQMPGGKDDAFLGLTPTEVRAKLGEPKYSSRIATQGRLSIQWIYESTRGSQYIDFVQRAGEAQPVVVGRFSIR